MLKSLAAVTLLAAVAPVVPVGAQTAPTQTATATLEVRFVGIGQPTGTILLSLYDGEAAHDGDGKPARVAAVPVAADGATARFAGLAPGRYAIKAFHDVDGNGRMNTNPFGMPLEPYAFSNDAKAEGGPARWQASSFAVAGGETRITITIQ